MVRRITTLYYVFSALNSFGTSVIAAMYVIFLLTHELNAFQVNLVNVAFFITITIGELPTGAFADVYGRKKSYIVSCFIYTAGMFLYAKGETLIEFVIAESMGGIALTFSSGAFRAWFVDRLEHHNSTESLHSIFAKSQKVELGARIIASIAGAIMGGFSLTYPWITSGITFLILGLSAMFLDEEYWELRKSKNPKHLSMQETVINSWRYLRVNTKIRFVIVASLILSCFTQGPNMQWQPFFEELGEDVSMFGYIFSSMMVALMIGAHYSTRIVQKLGSERTLIIVCLVITGLLISLTALMNTYVYALTVFILHEIPRGMLGPAQTSILEENASSEFRATLGSFESLAKHGAGTIGLLGSGFLALTFGIPNTWIVSGLLMVVCGLLLSIKQKN